MAVPPESPIEEAMAAILEDGPGTGCRAAFLVAADWREALLALRDRPEILMRGRTVVVPQVSVLRHRPDFMVVAGDGLRPVSVRGAPRHAFFVECDGAEFHGQDRIEADLRRERAVRAETGMEVLRFSGGEISFHPGKVSLVVAARIEAMRAAQECGPGALEGTVEAVERAVAVLSCHPLLRPAYGSRNAPGSADPYDPFDPSGEEWDRDTARRRAEWDPFLGLATAVAELRHAVARHRAAETLEDTGIDEDPLRSSGEGFQALGRILCAAPPPAGPGT